jgi:hypothetical protein
MDTPTGYVQGLSAAEAVSSDRPISRADEQFKPVKQLQAMIETKRILIRDIERLQDRDTYLRERNKQVATMEAARAVIEGLDSRYANGPIFIARLQKEIADLEGKVALTENQSQVKKFLELKAMLAAAGIAADA